MRKRGRPPYPDLLTPREQEVLSLLREGLNNPQIADRLGISRDGVKYHVSEILSKLGVSSREEAARWRPPEERRPWWAGAFAPVGWLWRRAPSGPVAMGAATVLFLVVLAGIGLLVWGLVRSDGSAETAAGVAGPGELLWQRVDEFLDTSVTIRSVTPGTCGDADTAREYSVPQMLRVEGEGTEPEALLLGLEREPYAYRPHEVEAPDEFFGEEFYEVAPEGWKLMFRVAVATRIEIVDQEGPEPSFWPRETFLRRLNRPDELFRYHTAYCDQDDGSPTGVEHAPLQSVDEEAYAVPEDAPIVMEHVGGDYLSLDAAFEQAELHEMSEVVVAELGRRNDLELLDQFDWSLPAPEQDEVYWFIVARFLNVGPVRPGEEYGLRAYVGAVDGEPKSLDWSFELVSE